MKIFIICCLYVYTCEYVYIYHAYVYRKSLFLLLCCHTKRVSGIHSGFGYPRVWFWGRIITRIGVRCGFGFWVLVLGFGFVDGEPYGSPHRPYYREVDLGNKAHSPIAKKNTEQSNVQDQKLQLGLYKERCPKHSLGL